MTTVLPLGKQQNRGKKFLIVVAGATAVGKTRVAIELAAHFETEILSADSRQIYKEMNIGTAKPTTEELAASPHHFVGCLSVQENFTAGDFEQQGIILLKHLFEKYNTVVLVGGTGLYIKALCEGLDFYPDVPPHIRQNVAQTLATYGIESLQNELLQLDPLQYARMDIRNPQRLARAVEVCRAAGQPFSSFQNQPRAPRFFTPIYVHVELPRAELYQRIDARVLQMMDDGLLEEAKTLYPFRHLNALQTVGYQEFFDYFDGKIRLEQAIALVQQNSRRYAKRQLTWFKKDTQWQLFSPTNVENILHFIEKKRTP